MKKSAASFLPVKEKTVLVQARIPVADAAKMKMLALKHGISLPELMIAASAYYVAALQGGK